MPGLLSLRPFASMARADKFFKGACSDRSKAEVKQQPRSKSMRSKVLPLQNSAHAAEAHVEEKGRINVPCNCGDESDDCQPSSACMGTVVGNFVLDGIHHHHTGTRICECLSGHCIHVTGKLKADQDTVIPKEALVVLQSLTPCTSARERSLLLDVSMFLRTVQEAPLESGSRDSSRASLHRKLMMHLRLLGYEAAVCNSRWDHSHGFPGGDYEYLDVVEVPKFGTQIRLIIDIDFRSQFEIARPTPDYLMCLQMLPAVFVGKVERLQEIVDIVSDASRRSLTKREMHIPPWRKTEYMRSKWLSPFQRAFVDVPALASIGSCQPAPLHLVTDLSSVGPSNHGDPTALPAQKLTSIQAKAQQPVQPQRGDQIRFKTSASDKSVENPCHELAELAVLPTADVQGRGESGVGISGVVSAVGQEETPVLHGVCEPHCNVERSVNVAMGSSAGKEGDHHEDANGDASGLPPASTLNCKESSEALRVQEFAAAVAEGVRVEA